MSTTQIENTSMESKNTITGAKGITFSGDTFIVPETHDMVKTLFDPTVRKSNFEMMILLILASNGAVFWLINNNQLRIQVFVGLYLFWRLSYNFGIGYLLHQQSNYNKLVSCSQKSEVFKKDNGSFLAKLVKAEIKSQMGSNYHISDYPIEFNTWLIFRKVVDLILMSDFTTFICLFIACSINDNYQFINGQSVWLINTRLVFGTFLILFNLWVKINAHNTIKDYAWYWGDFFFRQINNEELIFDGVFEMVPHPMYSVGYVGYYGFALISKSYCVLVVALFGHFLQMIFLHYIENPHINKIYGPSGNEADTEKLMKLKDLKHFDNMKPLVGLYNFNLLRASDLINLILVCSYSFIIPIFASLADQKSFNVKSIIFFLTISIKLFESTVINVLLILQSYYKTFTKWYLSNDIPVEESLNNWAIMYNTLINLTYSSFFGLNLYCLLTGDNEFLLTDWFYLRCFLGFVLIATQVWINSSIIDSIGYFGWFYGDFFIPKTKTHLTKAGVYRYLNNPEQIFGVSGIIGVTLMFPTLENLVCCVLWVSNNFFRINFIEKLHMVKVYGEQEVLQDSGVTKTFKKHLIPNAIQRRLSEGESKRRNSLTESLDLFIRELRKSNSNFTKQNILELSQNLNFANSDYKLTIITSDIRIGDPIEIEWKAPIDHSKKDWIGLYKVVQTSYSRNKTLVSSTGRWTWCESIQGSYSFEGDKLFWEEGIYEFRYHLDGKHEVAYISEPFEIKANKIEVSGDLNKFANELKEKVFDKVISIGSIDDSINTIINKSENIINTYNHLSYLISNSTDIKISPKVFLTDELTIKKLSLKLVNMKKLLDDLSHEKYIIHEDKKQE